MPVVRYNQANVLTQPMNEKTSFQTSPEALTGGLDKTMSAAAKVMAEEIEKADDSRVLKAKQQLSAAANAFLNDSKSGVLNARGENAFSSQERYSNEFAPMVDQIKNGLNERQRAKFGQYEFDITQNMNKNIEGHVAKERFKVDEDNTEAFLLNEQQSAVYDYTDFDAVEKSIERQKNEVRSMADRNGLSVESAAQRAMVTESKTRTIVVEQLVNSNNSKTAKEYLNLNKQSMLPSDVIRLEKLVKDGADLQEAQNTADSIISQYYDDPKAAIAQANKSFKDNVKMRDDVKQRLFLHFDEQDKADRAKKEDTTLYGINLAASNRGVPVQDLMPKEMWSGMNDREKSNLIKFAQYGYPNQDNYDVFYKLKLMSSNPATRRDFMNEDLRSYAADITKSSLDSFVNLQSDMRSGKSDAAKTLDGVEAQTSIVNNSLVQSGYDLKSKNEAVVTEMNQYRRAVDQQVAEWHSNNPGKKIPNEELRRITTTLSADVVTGKGTLWGVRTKPAFMVNPTEDNVAIRFTDIPKSEANIIRQTLINNGIQPTEQAIMDRYQKRLNRILGN